MVEWKIDQEILYKKSLNTSLINTEQRKYRFIYKTRILTRNDCGAKFILKATNAMGRVEETVKVDIICKCILVVPVVGLVLVKNITIFFLVKPSTVLIKSIYRRNASCVKIIWHKEETGNCILYYQLQLDGNSEIFFTSNTYFTMCTLLNNTSVSIWASHKGEIEDITVGRISLATPAPENKEIIAGIFYYKVRRSNNM